jgi:hypothetical protein
MGCIWFMHCQSERQVVHKYFSFCIEWVRRTAGQRIGKALSCSYLYLFRISLLFHYWCSLKLNYMNQNQMLHLIMRYKYKKKVRNVVVYPIVHSDLFSVYLITEVWHVNSALIYLLGCKATNHSVNISSLAKAGQHGS